MQDSKSLPLIVIAGPTGSGKTALSVELAKKYGGEIICADSRTIYKGLDIGSAKPSASERAEVPHWGIDLVQPGDRFTAFDFQQYAYKKIQEIRSRGHIPILVGGTGLYIDAVLHEYTFSTKQDSERRVELSNKSIEELAEYCIENNITLPVNKKNKRHLVGAILTQGKQPTMQKSLQPGTIVIGLLVDREVLKSRLLSRIDEMIKNGVVEEAVKMSTRYGWDIEAMTGNAYPIIKRFIDGEIDADQMRVLMLSRDMQLAKRQVTWFKRHDYVNWLDTKAAYEYAASSLDNLG